ncbi:MAG: hypothetical protein IJB86_06320 [Clostridia bacterium]|nr:hypothetical protein [Clostridia bacterium]
MKKTSLIRILYAYLITQIVVLSVAASAIGVVIAADRTDYIQNGREVSVRMEKTVPDTKERAFRILLKEDVQDGLCSLPAPIGSVISLIVSIENLVDEHHF